MSLYGRVLKKLLAVKEHKGCCGNSRVLGANAFRLVANADPSRTLTLRNEFGRDMKRRFNALARDIRKTVADHDALGLSDSTAIAIQEAAPPKAFDFRRSDQKVRGFMTWLNKQEAQGLLTITTMPDRLNGGLMQAPWANKYVQTSYRKGIIRGLSELKGAGYRVSESNDMPGRSGFSSGFIAPVHADRLALLYTRTFSELEGITRAMDMRISRTLAQGMADGVNPNVMARNLVRDVNFSMRRAIVMARTEVIRAHHQANIQEYRNAGVLGVRVIVEWMTAGDFRVCRRCKSLNKKRFTLDEIDGMIPLHPL
ncbi:hypothetical protein LCGC14_0775360 [marine sediment metagenome]|uniref:Phage head morphogenesis domain-containing protein n=1 Tax=marine sediment metagenome TaxID=412755 RepID=A0A0F9SGZ7_9ZZZZ